MTAITSQYCISGSLTPFRNDWGSTLLEQKRNVQHLFHRMTFGASNRDIQWALTKTPSQVVDILVNNALSVSAPGLTVHTWADKHASVDVDFRNKCITDNPSAIQNIRRVKLRTEWAHGMIGRHSSTDSISAQEIDRGKRFKYKMSYFWHDHFAINRNVLNGSEPLMWYKYALIHNAVGNFKMLVKDIGLSQAMLGFLDVDSNWWRPHPDDVSNGVSDPFRADPDWQANENYARELLELFVIGAAGSGQNDGYTQADIDGLSKVFTGWRYEYWSPSPAVYGEHIFQPNLHDWSSKSIFGENVTPTLPTHPSVDSTNFGNYNIEVAWPVNSSTPFLVCNPSTGQTVPYVDSSGTTWYVREEIRDHPKVVFGNASTPGIAEAMDEYNEVHDIIFGDHPNPANPANTANRKLRISRHICTKLYKFFVYEHVCENTVNQLANIFIANNWALAPVLKELFKSEHFFSSKARGAQIQSPLGAFYNLHNNLGTEYHVDYFPNQFFFDPNYNPSEPYGFIGSPQNNPPALWPWYQIWQYATGSLDHLLFEPPNVAGWSGYRAWINEYSFYKLGQELAVYMDPSDPVRPGFKDLRIGNIGPRYKTTHETWRDLMKALVPPIDWDKPDVIVKAVAEHFIIVDLLPTQLAEAECVFREIVPTQHWSIWNLDYDLNPPLAGTAEENKYIINQFIDLIQYLVRIPENFLT